MIALNKCKFKVVIRGGAGGSYSWWSAYPNPADCKKIGVNWCGNLLVTSAFKNRKGSKANAERFRKVNKIAKKNWEYVETVIGNPHNIVTEA